MYPWSPSMELLVVIAGPGVSKASRNHVAEQQWGYEKEAGKPSLLPLDGASKFSDNFQKVYCWLQVSNTLSANESRWNLEGGQLKRKLGSATLVSQAEGRGHTGRCSSVSMQRRLAHMQSHPVVPKCRAQVRILRPPPPDLPNANCWGPLGNRLAIVIGLCS